MYHSGARGDASGSIELCRRPSLSRLGGSDASHATLRCSDAIDAKRHARYAIDARRAAPQNNLPQKPYDDPKFASHVLYLSANSLADGFVPFKASETSSWVTRFAPINLSTSESGTASPPRELSIASS